MDALMASYGDTSSESESEPEPDSECTGPSPAPKSPNPLPPPPIDLLSPPNFTDTYEYLQREQASRIRNFPHVEGNYAVHVYIPVRIPASPKKEMAQFLKKISSILPNLNVVDIDIPLNKLSSDNTKLEQVALGREFHISLGRTVPIRVHQLDSLVAMLRQKLQSYKRYWIDFHDWEIFVNDDKTRSFLSIEVKTGGLSEITKQIQVVNEVYKLHNLPEFYKDPRPHISIAWGCGDISESMKAAVKEAKQSSTVRVYAQKNMFTCKFGGIDCKIGNKTYRICKPPE